VLVRDPVSAVTLPGGHQRAGCGDRQLQGTERGDFRERGAGRSDRQALRAGEHRQLVREQRQSGLRHALLTDRVCRRLRRCGGCEHEQQQHEHVPAALQRDKREMVRDVWLTLQTNVISAIASVAKIGHMPSIGFADVGVMGGQQALALLEGG